MHTNWTILAIRNVFPGQIFLGVADKTDVKIGRMIGYGGRISRETVFEALAWRRKINDAGFLSVDAFPGDHGEILVSGLQNDIEFEIIVEENRSLTIRLSCGDSVLREVPCGNVEAADSVLREAAVRLWTSSGGLRVTSSTGERCASLASPSEIPRSMVASL